MSFNDSAQLDTSQVESGGSRGGGGGGGFPGGIQVGGGIGGLILLILTLIFGGNVLGGGDSGGTGAGGLPSEQLQSDQVSAAGQVPDASIAACKTGADANRNDVCLVVATVNSVQDYWTKQLPKYQMNYEPAKTVIYQGQTSSGCGTANSQVGPFYCPLDSQGLRRRQLLPGAARASSAPTAASSPRSTSSRTSTATTSRTSSASSTAPSRTPRAPTPAPCASS